VKFMRFAAWIEPGQADVLQFEPPALALKRLHARLVLEAAKPEP
jgi:hypothetical protein